MPLQSITHRKGTYFFDYECFFTRNSSWSSVFFAETTSFKYNSYVQDIMGPMCFDYGFGPFRLSLCFTNQVAKTIKLPAMF
jgi:urocanate hydratase